MEPPEMSLHGLNQHSEFGEQFHGLGSLPPPLGPSHCRITSVQHHDLCPTPDNVEGRAE